MECEFGDVILVPFPFTDQRSSKRRSAVVVSTGRYNIERPDLIIMAVTSQPMAGTFETKISNWKEAGLISPSTIKPVLTTIEKSLVIKRLGTLSRNDQVALPEILRAILGPA